MGLFRNLSKILKAVNLKTFSIPKYNFKAFNDAKLHT